MALIRGQHLCRPRKAFLGPGTWNSLYVRLVGQKVNVTMNGERVIEVRLDFGADGRARPEHHRAIPGGPSRFNAGVPRPKSDFGTSAFGPSSPPASDPSEASHREVDLLKLVDPARDAVSGEWLSFADGSLVCRTVARGTHRDPL